jgi:hypothetical protein
MRDYHTRLSSILQEQKLFKNYWMLYDFLASNLDGHNVVPFGSICAKFHGNQVKRVWFQCRGDIQSFLLHLPPAQPNGVANAAAKRVAPQVPLKQR